MRFTKPIFCFLLITAAYLPAGAQQVHTYVMRDSVQVGEQFLFSISMDRPEAFDASVPALGAGASSVGDLEILSLKYERSVNRRGMLKDSLAFVVTTFALDQARVPPVNVMFVSGPDTVFAASAPMVIPVSSVVPEDADNIRDLAALAEFPRPWWVWLLAALLAAAAGVLIWYLYRRYRRRPSGSDAKLRAKPAPRPALSTLDEAMQRLAELERRLSAGEVSTKEFYVELTDALRNYISKTTSIKALEMTSGELISAFSRAEARGRYQVEPEMVASLRRILDVADQVKFADARPRLDTQAYSLERTGDLIRDLEALFNPPRLPAREQPEEMAEVLR